MRTMSEVRWASFGGRGVVSQNKNVCTANADIDGIHENAVEYTAYRFSSKGVYDKKPAFLPDAEDN